METDFDYVPYNAAYNSEPFRRPDYKAKRHGRPKKANYKRTNIRDKWRLHEELYGGESWL